MKFKVANAIPAVLLLVAGTANSQTVSWTSLAGLSVSNDAAGLALRSDGIYVTGSALIGSTQDREGYLSRYDAAGYLQWRETFQPPGAFYMGTAASANTTGVFVSGGLIQVSGVSAWRAYVQKYDSAGNQLWADDWDLPGGVRYPAALAADAGGVYVAGSQGLFGSTWLGFVRRYGNNGTPAWTQTFGSPGLANQESETAVAVDDTGVYVTGTFGYNPIIGIVRRLGAAAGAQIWQQTFNIQGYDVPSAIALSPDGVYVAGTTWVPASGGGSGTNPTAFVRKYDRSGNALWDRQFAIGSTTQLFGVAADANGVYLCGQTGDVAAFVRRYDHSGNVVWTFPFRQGSANAVAVDDSGVYAAGNTLAAAGWDSFLTKVIQPAPAVAADLASAVGGLDPQPAVNGLLAMAKQILQSVSNAQKNAACGMIAAFVNEVKAQTGKSISPDQAADLLSLAAQLSSGLGCK